MFQSENASAKAFFLSAYMKQWQKSSKMVSTNSAVMVFACRTSPIQTVTSYTTNMARILTFPALSSPTLSPRLRPQGNCLPLLVMATIQLCARSLESKLSSSRAWGQAPEEGVLPGWLPAPGWEWECLQEQARRV